MVGGGAKMSAAVRQEVTKSLINLMSSEEDSIRTLSAVCLGVMLAFMPDEEKTDIIINHLTTSGQ